MKYVFEGSAVQRMKGRNNEALSFSVLCVCEGECVSLITGNKDNICRQDQKGRS